MEKNNFVVVIYTWSPFLVLTHVKEISEWLMAIDRAIKDKKKEKRERIIRYKRFWQAVNDNLPQLSLKKIFIFIFYF